MAKKLKKKIREICGLNIPDWEARQERAAKILASPEWKQSLCNELIGLSFRELERYLSGVASEREKKEESYERKLEAYNSGRFNKPPKRGSDAKKPLRPGVSGPKSKNKPPRTLEQILAQVYAPRVVQGMELQVKSTYLDFRGTEPSDEVLSDPSDGDSSPDE